MTAFWLAIAGAAAAVGIPIALSRAPAQVSPKADLAYWNRINAEVISMIRVRDHIFLRVRFTVGTTIIQTDVELPSTEPIPHAGRQVAIRYDPTAPARASVERLNRKS